MITRQEGFMRLAREYVAMQGAPREPGVFSELYVRGFEAAVETALGRQEEGMSISWVRLAFDRALDDVLWMEDGPGFITPGRTETIVTLLQFEWGLYGNGSWESVEWADEPAWTLSASLGDILGHDEQDPTGLRLMTTWWRLWPSGWELWVV